MTKPFLPDLDAFVAVARYRSFNRAAIERGVSRSALSHAVRVLEERLGIRLLNRTTRSVTPTEAGQRLLARLTPALADVRDALDELNGFRDTPIGTLTRTPKPLTSVSQSTTRSPGAGKGDFLDDRLFEFRDLLLF